MNRELIPQIPGAGPGAIQAVADCMSSMTPRFHLQTQRRPDVISWPDLLNPEVVSVQIDMHTVSRNITDRQVAASLFVQGIATHVISTTLAAELVLGIPLRPRSDQFWILPGVPHMVWGVDADHTEVDLTAVEQSLDRRVADWISYWPSGHFRDLIDSVKQTVRVGRRMLEGNVASAIGNALVFLDWWERTDHVVTVAEAVIAHPSVAEHASLTDLTVKGRTGLRSNRSSCCLLLRVEGSHACPTCPVVSDAERIATTSMHVGHLLAVRPLYISEPSTDSDRQ